MAFLSDTLNRGLARLTGRRESAQTLSDKPYPFHVEIERDLFMRLKIEGLYKRILSDCVRRSIWTHQHKSDIERAFYDCFENSENNRGLVSCVANAMYNRTSKTLVFRDGVLREATRDEAKEIKTDYKLVSKSDKGIIINFTNYELTRILRHYFSQMYDVNMSRTTAVNVASAVKIQISKLREMVNNDDASNAISQAREIVDALQNGRPALLDADDKVDAAAQIDVDPIVSAKEDIYSEISQQTGLPVAYISGIATTGASVIGDADINRESEGLEPYWLSIWKPIVSGLFGIKDMQYRTDRWRAMESKVRTIAMVESLDTLSDAEKRQITEHLLELSDATQN